MIYEINLHRVLVIQQHLVVGGALPPNSLVFRMIEATYKHQARKQTMNDLNITDSK